MGVRKIFIMLITVVACVIIGAFTLNILLPNVTTTVIDATEDMIFKATGMAFDFNNNGNLGDNGSNYTGNTAGGDDTVTGGVEGFK